MYAKYQAHTAPATVVEPNSANLKPEATSTTCTSLLLNYTEQGPPEQGPPEQGPKRYYTTSKASTLSFTSHVMLVMPPLPPLPPAALCAAMYTPS